MVHSHRAPHNRNIWSSRLADSFVCFSNSLYTTTISQLHAQRPPRGGLVLATDSVVHSSQSLAINFSIGLIVPSRHPKFQISWNFNLEFLKFSDSAKGTHTAKVTVVMAKNTMGSRIIQIDRIYGDRWHVGGFRWIVTLGTMSKRSTRTQDLFPLSSLRSTRHFIRW